MTHANITVDLTDIAEAVWHVDHSDNTCSWRLPTTGSGMTYLSGDVDGLHAAAQRLIELAVALTERQAATRRRIVGFEIGSTMHGIDCDGCFAAAHAATTTAQLADTQQGSYTIRHRDEATGIDVADHHATVRRVEQPVA